ncbi:MAG: DNA polymerase I [Candidatus Rokubacteria bacterium]|nr:DNA polymerase I [Candidatus Rokubacteria bacterium]
MADRLYLVDGNSYLYRAYHAIAHLSTSKGLPTNATFGMTNMLWKIVREEAPEYMAVAWDSPAPTFRHQAFEAYKIQRPGMPSDPAEQIPWVKTVLEAMRLPLLEAPGYEADDLLATVVARAAGSGLHVVLVTADKDALQLVGPTVTVLSVLGRTGERVLYDEAKVLEKWGVPPARIPDLLGLMGDAIDNIPGVPGVGEVTARKLIRQFGSLEGLYASLALVSGAKLRETLARHREQAFFSRQLATVDAQVPVEIDLARFRRAAPDWARLRGLWTELEFSSLLRMLPAEPATVTREAVPVLDSEGWAAYRRAAGEALAVEPILAGSVPDLALQGLGVFSPEAGPAYLTGAPPALGAGRVIGHDLKPFLAWAEARGLALPRFEDTAVTAYLLNSARVNFNLEELCLEALGAAVPGGGAPTAADPGTLAAWAGGRARGVFTLWERQQEELARDGLLSLYRDLELPLVPVLARMELAGIRVDPGRLEVMAKELERQLDSLTREIHTLAGEPVNPASPRQLAQVLFEKLGLPAVKRTKTGYSTDVDVLEELALAHPLPAKILEYRQLAKLKGTYADALPALVHPRTGRIHTSFNQFVTATGRLSSSAPNLQNIPVRTELGRRIRQAFVAEPGWVFLAADYSQIELRVLAHLSGEAALLEAFRRDEDIHARTAAEIFGVAPELVTAEMRRVAKGVNFGIVYGISAFGLAQATGVGREAAQRYIDEYFARHPKVRAFIEETLAGGRERGYVSTLLGRRRYLPELRSGNPNARGMAERMAMNSPVQGSAADLIKLAMVRVHRALGARGLRSRMLLQVHDELLFEVPEAERGDLSGLVRGEMEAAYPLAVPLKVDVKEGRDWAEL